MLFPNLKTLRELKNYTQKYMAKELGMAQNSYSLLESGKTEMDIGQLMRLSEILAVSPSVIVGSPLEIPDFKTNRVSATAVHNVEEIGKLTKELEEKDRIIKMLVDQLSDTYM